jgi:hypothetical protein
MADQGDQHSMKGSKAEQCERPARRVSEDVNLWERPMQWDQQRSQQQPVQSHQGNVG